ncbi:cell division cycle protein 20 homolog B-like [Pungitius pungitius]|uniref:cell division cycle protein 20 homolog B-like n=1 Tax=Pungitius pungitius TaxID=134920 RepID=UPI002E13E188
MKKKRQSTNSRADNGTSRSTVRPMEYLGSRVRPGEQTTGAPGTTKLWKVEMKLTGAPSNDWGRIDAHRVSYKRFRRRIIQKSASGGPAASTPLATWRQREPSFELHTVRQRLELDSPPRLREPAARGPPRETAHTPRSFPARGRPAPDNTPQQGWVWEAAVPEHQGSDERRRAMQPFALLDKTSTSQLGKSVVKLAAPSLLNDYYTHLLDCSCKGVIALALGSSVYLWNSQTGSLVGYLDPSPHPGLARHPTPSISCLSWSRDGGTLSIGTRRGEIQLWDVEHKRNMRCLPSHLSVVRGLSWNQHLLSSGSALGRIHHLDPRAPEPLVGAIVQAEAVCGLQWSPGGDRLASGSTEGLLCIWGGDMAGVTWSRQPISTMRQPSAVKAMAWCPWQRRMIATGGGWTDGELRVWDTDSGTCVTSANTDSQICSLRWAEKKKCLVTGHGLPHYQVSCWSCPLLPVLGPVYRMSGHSQRVLHLAVSPDGSQIFSAGADQQFHIWDV